MKIKIFIALLIAPLLCSCSFTSIGSEPEEVAVIAALGFDVKSNKLFVTAQLSNEENSLIFSEGNNAKEAVDKLNEVISGRLYLSHCAIAVLSKNLNKEQTDDVLNFLINDNEFPLAGAVAVSDNAQKLLASKSSSTLPLGYDLLNILVIKSRDFRLYRVIETKEFPCFAVENNTYRLQEELWTNQNLFPPI